MSSVPPPPLPATAPPAPPERADDEPPWASWTVLAAIGVGFGVFLCSVVVITFVAQAAGANISHPTPAVSLTENLMFDLSFVGAALYFAVLHGRARLADFGFRRVALGRGVAAFVLAGVGYYVLTALYASLLRLHGSDKLPNELGVSKSTAALIAAAVFVCVLAPIAEELFFRGFVFGALRRWRIVIAGRQLGTWAAALVTGAFFGAVHAGSASPQFLVPLGLLGFVLCLVRWRTRSLYPCMALHAFNNSLALGIDQLHWNAGEILGLAAASLAAIAAITLPLVSSD